MDEARLAEIETYCREAASIRISPLYLAEEIVPELLAEVRRLQTDLTALTDAIDTSTRLTGSRRPTVRPARPFIHPDDLAPPSPY